MRDMRKEIKLRMDGRLRNTMGDFKFYSNLIAGFSFQIEIVTLNRPLDHKPQLLWVRTVQTTIHFAGHFM